MSKEPTKQEVADYCEKMIIKLKAKDSLFDLKVEFGRLLMIHINDFTPEQRKRYDELKEILK